MSVAIISLFPASGMAESIEQLLMPGPVIEGHAKYEQECSRCHQPLGEKTQKQLCLDCHKKINQDVKKAMGFHGQKDMKPQDCKTCHTDHKGRDAKIVLLNPDRFDHDATDFKLEGRHQGLECNSCHQPDKKFRDAKHECVDCHKDDDVHKQELGTDCNDCHTEQSWTKTKFDHDKTKFKLKGQHKKTACLSCHVTETYTDAPKQCYGCHQVNDIHNQRFGKDCDDCHRETKWKTIFFDHDKTDYPLTGSHKTATCNSCHPAGDLHKKLPNTCIGCHRNDDIHAGRNGEKCKSCHNTKSWKAKFDHDKDTDFELHGRHQDLECTTCHKGDIYQELPMDCFDCHQQSDVHQGSQGKQCSNCHNETDWQQQIVFDHDLTKFPLSGLHATASCEDCHASADFKQAETQCIKCHEQNDEHKKRLGDNCQLCHTPNSWNLWLFDHDKQTEYRLTGKHEGLICEACHNKAVTDNEDLKISSECNSCHRADDIHEGRFGKDCSRCHDTDSFEDFIFKTP